MNVGERMKERRKALGISADELGKKLGKDRSTIYRYENGEIETVPYEKIETIAKNLDTTPQFLMGWTNIEQNHNKGAISNNFGSESTTTNNYYEEASCKISKSKGDINVVFCIIDLMKQMSGEQLKELEKYAAYILKC